MLTKLPIYTLPVQVLILSHVKLGRTERPKSTVQNSEDSLPEVVGEAKVVVGYSLRDHHTVSYAVPYF
jgi:hypothetical protein